ncbi:MAG: hypothetical protein CL927_16935 [Deltaproteobacteria bacterium]|nr:hypothetical protein [Deltaproteobacteria bacterium]HCH61955.1 hypothetical protein [Deltaproteobacteria bacterium]
MRYPASALFCSLFLFGCSSKTGTRNQSRVASEDATGTSGSESTTDSDDPDTASAGDTGEPEVPLDADFVMDSVLLLPSADGFDLTGDGVPNNALAELFENELIGEALGGSPNGYIAQSVQRGELLVMLDFVRLGSYADDSNAGIEMLLGAGEDDSDLFSGDATLQVRCGSLTPDGAAASAFDTVQVVDHALDGAPGEFLFLMPFAIDTTVVLRQSRIEGVLRPDGSGINSGRLGGSVTFGDLREVVRNDPEIGPDFGTLMLAILEGMLDVDQDGDGTPDALSAMFRYTAVSSTIDRDAACVED